VVRKSYNNRATGKYHSYTEPVGVRKNNKSDDPHREIAKGKVGEPDRETKGYQ